MSGDISLNGLYRIVEIESEYRFAINENKNLEVPDRIFRKDRRVL